MTTGSLLLGVGAGSDNFLSKTASCPPLLPIVSWPPRLLETALLSLRRKTASPTTVATAFPAVAGAVAGGGACWTRRSLRRSPLE